MPARRRRFFTQEGCSSGILHKENSTLGDHHQAAAVPSAAVLCSSHSRRAPTSVAACCNVAALWDQKCNRRCMTHDEHARKRCAALHLPAHRITLQLYNRIWHAIFQVSRLTFYKQQRYKILHVRLIEKYTISIKGYAAQMVPSMYCLLKSSMDSNVTINDEHQH